MIHQPHKPAAAVLVSPKTACGHLVEVTKHLWRDVFQLLALDAELNLALLSMDPESNFMWGKTFYVTETCSRGERLSISFTNFMWGKTF
jgi:hypothetical protein